MRATVLVSSLLLGACVHVAPAPIDLQAAGERLAKRSLEGAEVAAALTRFDIAHVPGEPWTLDQFTVAAWVLRTEVAEARLDMQAALADAAAAGRPLFPSFSVLPEYVTNGAAGVNPWTVTLAAGWTIESGGKRARRAEAGQAAVDVASARLGELLWQVREEVRSAWIDLALGEARSASAAEEAALRDDFAAWVGAQVRFGAAARPSLLSAEVEAASARAAADTAEAEVSAARGRLSRALALPAEAVAQQPLAALDLAALPPAAALDVGALQERALFGRLDLRRGLADYAAAEATLRVELARQYPDLVLGPGVGYDRGDHKLVFGLGVNLPDPAGQRHLIDRAVVARSRAALEVERLQTVALAEVSAAIADYRAAQPAVARAAAAVDERAAIRGAVERRRALGSADRGDFLAARLLELGEQRALLAARRTAADAESRLETALERPIWPPSELSTADLPIAVPIPESTSVPARPDR